jgi:hypothetical protein
LSEHFVIERVQTKACYSEKEERNARFALSSQATNNTLHTHTVHTPKFGVCMPYIHIFFHLGKNKIKAKTTYCSQKKIPNNIAYKKGKFTKIKLIIITKNNSIIYLFTYFLAFI